MKHLLVLDDDERLRELLKRYLVKQGYQVSTSENAANARKLLASFSFDLLIVDVMMPIETGMSFVRSIRPENDVPVLMLTAKAEIEDRIEGFEAGVDDFVAKPFDPKELSMRIDAILRRAQMREGKTGFVKFGEYFFDLSTQMLAKGEDKIDLTRNERDLIAIFADNINETLSREDLSQGLEAGNDLRSVDVIITRLRKKLERDPRNPQYIQTVRGKGYKLHSPS